MQSKHQLMPSIPEADYEEYWIQVGGEGRMHPYSMHKTVSQDEVDVTHCVSDDVRHPRRWIFIRNGEHEALAMKRYAEEYGYDVRPEERISTDELEAIQLKQEAIRDGASVSVEEARELVSEGTAEKLPHALIALFYAAKADPDVTDNDVAELREIVHDHTRHVDTSHIPTVKRLLNDSLSDLESVAE